MLFTAHPPSGFQGQQQSDHRLLWRTRLTFVMENLWMIISKSKLSFCYLLKANKSKSLIYISASYQTQPRLKQKQCYSTSVTPTSGYVSLPPVDRWHTVCGEQSADFSPNNRSGFFLTVMCTYNFLFTTEHNYIKPNKKTTSRRNFINRGGKCSCHKIINTTDNKANLWNEA